MLLIPHSYLKPTPQKNPRHTAAGIFIPINPYAIYKASHFGVWSAAAEIICESQHVKQNFIQFEHILNYWLCKQVSFRQMQ
jgi:hypothetical protein